MNEFEKKNKPTNVLSAPSMCQLMEINIQCKDEQIISNYLYVPFDKYLIYIAEAFNTSLETMK
jgi:hypothetical protein